MCEMTPARAGWAAHEAASKREDMALTEVAKLKDDLEAERVDSVLAEAERNAAVALVRRVAEKRLLVNDYEGRRYCVACKEKPGECKPTCPIDACRRFVEGMEP